MQGCIVLRAISSSNDWIHGLPANAVPTFRKIDGPKQKFLRTCSATGSAPEQVAIVESVSLRREGGARNLVDRTQPSLQ